MPAPPQVLEWVKRTYPKPTVDPEWVDACYSWIETEFHFDLARELDKILPRLETQLLESDLSTSMVPGTGLPANVSKLDNMTLRGPPILVEIISMTDIGSSAFNLQSIRQARIEQADLAGLAEEEGEEEDGPRIPKYPRSMLKFELSDGKTTLEAIEYRRLPDLELGVTPLGFKMLLKNVFIRRGVAFLEPSNVMLKGHQTEERQAMADEIFVQGLRSRLEKQSDEVDGVPPAGRQPVQNAPALENNRNNAVRVVPQAPQARAPASSSTSRAVEPQHLPAAPAPAPPAPAPSRPSGVNRSAALGPKPPHTSHDNDDEKPLRGKVSGNASSAARASTSTGHTALTHSKFFVPPADSDGRSDTATGTGTSKGKQKEIDLTRLLRLSPHRASPLFFPDSEEDEGGAPMDVDADDADLQRHDTSSDYDWGAFDENELQATMDKTEREAFARSSGASTPAEVSSTSTTAARMAVVNASLGQQSEPIYISDSDEKENAPVVSHRTRRRIEVAEEDIIEVSD